VPIHSKELKSKSGFNVLRSVYEEPVTVQDAERFMQGVRRGGIFHDHGHLVLGNVVGISGEVRKVLGSEKADPHNPPPVALVIASAMVRMVASLAMRAGSNENTEFFKDEGQALEWLDTQLATYEARRSKGPLKKVP
jgi:hypothetical protein